MKLTKKQCEAVVAEISKLYDTAPDYSVEGVNNAINALPEKFQQLIEMYFIKKMSYRAMAEVLGVSYIAVRKSLLRCLYNLGRPGNLKPTKVTSNSPIAVLKLSSRVYNTLMHNGITTCGTLLMYDNKGLRHIANLGPVGVSEIDNKLKEYAL